MSYKAIKVAPVFQVMFPHTDSEEHADCGEPQLGDLLWAYHQGIIIKIEKVRGGKGAGGSLVTCKHVTARQYRELQSRSREFRGGPSRV